MNVAKRPSKPNVAKHNKHKRRPAKPPSKPRSPLFFFGGGGGGGLDTFRRQSTMTDFLKYDNLPNWISSTRSSSVTIA